MYKYYTSASPLTFDSTKTQLLNEYQSYIYSQFHNSPTLQTIQEEVVFGSGSFVDVTVRVNTAINSTTGTKLGDDFKIILFPDLTHSTGLGNFYYFDNNYWVVVYSETIKNLVASCMVRRCNNTLRWIGVDGIYYHERCAIDYEISRPRDSIGTLNPVMPQGYITIYTQLNDRTKLIKANQRFLFGTRNNRIAYKVFGDGVRNFLNQETDDDESARLLMLTMGGNFLNEDVDDLTNGIADFYSNVFALSVTPTTIAGNIADTYQLVPALTLNGDAITRSLTYTTSASPKATVSGSGLVTLVSAGSAIVTCSITDNYLISASSLINVSASGTVLEEVRFLPTTDYILEGDTHTFTVYVYNSGSPTANTFTFVTSGSVPAANYIFTGITGNSFSVKNVKRYLNSELTITATSGSYSGSKSLELRGGW